MVKDNFEALLQAEKEARTRMDAVREDLTKSIREAYLSSVKEVSHAPRCVVVSVSFLGPNLNLDPSYYIQESQAEAVNAALQKRTTASSFLAALDDMLSSGKVKLGREVTSLNEETLHILREAYTSLNIH